MDAQAMLFYLAGVSVRALAIAGVAWVALAVFRVRSAAGRHAVWTFTMAGILALPALNPILPAVRVPIKVVQSGGVSASGGNAPLPARVQATGSQPARESFWRGWWKQAVLTIYAIAAFWLLAQLATGYAISRRLARRSRVLPLECAAAVISESSEISVPMTMGAWRPRILLPAGWREWDATKLRSVLAHEEAHVRRADWLILLMAAFTRCLLWFHPLTWALERHLAVLAEQACDDRALLKTGDREGYAQALLEMAQAVRRRQGRLVWAGIAMAKETQVKKRIDQILDETRPITGALSRARWVALLVLSLPPVYLLTAVQLIPAQAQTATKATGGPYQQWVSEDVAYLITAPEKTAFNNLQSDGERDRFIEQFWEQRNPTPGSATNSYKEEHYRRIAYANEHYAGNVAGWKTDRGRIYIQHGPPDELESHLPTAGAGAPYESWFYHRLEGMGENVVFRFVDSNREGNYRLTAPMETVQTLRARVQELSQRDNNEHPEGRQALSDPTQDSGPSASTLPQRIRVGANVQAANLINKVDPVYPPLAQQARIQGTVRFTAIIGKDGRIENLQLVSGHPLLVTAAQDAVRQWVYKPTLLNGDPVEVMTQVNVEFTLP